MLVLFDNHILTSDWPVRGSAGTTRNVRTLAAFIEQEPGNHRVQQKLEGEIHTRSQARKPCSQAAQAWNIDGAAGSRLAARLRGPAMWTLMVPPEDRRCRLVAWRGGSASNECTQRPAAA